MTYWESTIESGLFKTSVFLPVSSPFTTSIDIQISYFSGVRSSKSYPVLEGLVPFAPFWYGIW
jgi:hypothetical protein